MKPVERTLSSSVLFTYMRNKDKILIFADKAKKIHGGKYDYSNGTYTNSSSKLIIMCPIHGEFEQTPNSHLKGCGCPKCGIMKYSKSQSLGREKFISKANIVHNGKYDYSKCRYKQSKIKLTITCPIHGEFEQTPNTHLQEGLS